MSGDTHAVIGMTAATALMRFGIIDTDTIAILVTGVASFLPDVDHNNASVNRALNIDKFGYLMMAGILIYYAYVKRDFYLLFSAAVLIAVGLSRHRAMTHSLLAVVAVGLMTIKLDPLIRISVIIGYAGHLAADYFNVEGIEILWPNEKNYRAPMTISTGSFKEYILKMVFGVLFLINISYLYLDVDLMSLIGR